MKDRHKQARKHLRSMTTREIRGGLRAFAHPPRNEFKAVGTDAAGCFLQAAFGDDPAKVRAWIWGEFDALERCYENYDSPDDNEWLRTECLRELAERGAAAETSLSHYTDTKEPEPCHSSP